MAQFNEIQKLSTKQLNDYCNTFNIDATLLKAVKYNAVCHCLSISTCGADNISGFIELSISPVTLYTLQNWTKDLNKVKICSN